MKREDIQSILGLVLVVLALLSNLACDDRRPQRPSSADPGCVVDEGRESSLAYAFESTDALCRVRRLADALDAMGPSRTDEVSRFVDSNLWLIDDASLGLILRWQSEIDPGNGFERARGFHGSRRRAALALVLERWAELDPIAAAKALESIPAKRRTKDESLAVAIGWEASGQPDLDAFIASLDSTKARHAILGDVLTRIATRDGSVEMTEWVASRPDDLPNGFQLAAYRLSAATLARSDLEAARQWIEDAGMPAYRPPMVRAIALRWMQTDPSAAMAWVSQEPPGRERDQTVRESYRAFSRRDEPAAAAWLDDQPYEDWLEPALAFQLGALAHSDGAAAIAQIDRIKDEDRRQTATIAILRQWRLQDRAAADAWLASADLPEPTRKLLEPDQGRGRAGKHAHQEG